MLFYRVRHFKTVFHIMFGGRGKGGGKSRELGSTLAGQMYLDRGVELKLGKKHI